MWLRLSTYSAHVELAEVPVPTATLAANGTEGMRIEPVVEGTAESDPGGDPSRLPETAAQASARERRYQELLRQAPPPPPSPAPPPEKQSLFERVVAPIASAFGVGRAAKPAQTAAAPPTAHAQAQPQQQRQQAEQPSARTPEEPGNRAEDDRETDIVPPQLLTADFTPAQVQDGETTTFAVTVHDNLSGVRSVSGVITSPSGSLQGFACTRETPEGNRFIARITVPKDAAEGTWLVKYLTLSDNASNSINLNYAQGALPPTASFRVTSSSSDSSGPQLKAVWLERQAMRAGEKNTVFVTADDDKAGVSLVSGVFVSPGKAARIGFGCRAGQGGTWECPLTPPVCLDCGVWRLEQIQLQDKANNLATFRNDNQLVSGVVVDITADRCDGAAPTVTNLLVDPPVVTNAQPSVVIVRATMVDEGGCGVASLSGQAVPPGGVGGQRRYVSFEPSGDGQTFIGKLEIPQFAAKGQWTLAWIQALDKGHNLRAYSSSDPVVARATFRVE